MNYFFDTSALLKKYIEEDGSEKTENILEIADIIHVSDITLIECISTFKRLMIEKLIEENEYRLLKKECAYDFRFFSVIAYNEKIRNECIPLIDKQCPGESGRGPLL